MTHTQHLFPHLFSRCPALLLGAILTMALSSCVDSLPGESGGAAAVGNTEISTAKSHVFVAQGGQTRFIFQTARPNVEGHRILEGGKALVVKSRGSHGPATVEMFSLENGKRVGKVEAYDIRGGQPYWAAPFAE